MKIIDATVCLKSVDGKLDLADWLRQAKSFKIDHSVIAPSDEYIAVYNQEGNDQIAALANEHPRKLTGLAVANPWYGARAVEILEKAFNNGLCGLYLKPPRQGFQLTDHVIDPLLEVCRKYNKSVYSHTGTPICAMPFQLAELARRFPDIKFVMGHCAWSDFWYDVVAAAQQSDNILIDISCTFGGTVSNLIKKLGAERLVFSCGYPKSLPENETAKIKELNLTENIFTKIMYSNACQLWGIRP